MAPFSFESTAVICQLALGANSMFVRCVGILASRLCYAEVRVLSRRDLQQHNRASSVGLLGYTANMVVPFVWPAGVSNGVALPCITRLPSCYGSCDCTYVPRRVSLVSSRVTYFMPGSFFSRESITDGQPFLCGHERGSFCPWGSV